MWRPSLSTSLPNAPGAPGVLHLSWSDGVGGSARSAYKIHAGLRHLGLSSRMLVGWRVTDDPDVRLIKRNRVWQVMDNFAGRVTDRLALQYLAYPSSLGLLADPWLHEADVVQLYNVHAPVNVNFLSPTVFPLLSRRRPVVWRLSDMWALTGHCSYSFECDRWKRGCGSCPHLDVHPGLRHDTTALLWRVKRIIYRFSKLTLVAPSRWIESLARESPLLGRFPVVRIPNGVDLDVFHPRNRREARLSLGLPPEGRMVLLGAYEVRKGQDVMARALKMLPPESAPDLLFATLGARVPDIPEGLRHVHLGEIKDDVRLATILAAADLFVFPTLAENLPNMVLESLASGTPVVSFAVGGVPDAVRPGETGALVMPGDVEGLARSMDALLRSERLAHLSVNARSVAEQEYSIGLQARRFADLYDDLLSRGSTLP